MADNDPNEVYRWVIGDTAIEVSGIKLKGGIITSAQIEAMSEAERQSLIGSLRQTGAPIRRVPASEFEEIISRIERQ